MGHGFYLENLSLIIIPGIWQTRQIRQKDFLFHWAEFIALGFAASDMFPVKFGTVYIKKQTQPVIIMMESLWLSAEMNLVEIWFR